MLTGTAWPSQIFKPVADVTQEEAVAALNKALAEERGEKQSDAHGHGHQEASKAGGCEDGCCGADHGHSDGHGHAEKSAKHDHDEHGHAEQSADHGHDDHSGCCGGKHDHDHDHDEHDHTEHGHTEHGHTEHGHDSK